MILDTSAVMAVLLDEPGCDELLKRMGTAVFMGIGAPTLVEARIVIQSRLGATGLMALDQFLREGDVRVIPFTDEHALIARDAFLAYGKGRHPAALNFGDCLSYAVAKLSGMPLLYRGNDFARTDIGGPYDAP